MEAAVFEVVRDTAKWSLVSVGWTFHVAKCLRGREMKEKIQSSPSDMGRLATV